MVKRFAAEMRKALACIGLHQEASFCIEMGTTVASVQAGKHPYIVTPGIGTPGIGTPGIGTPGIGTHGIGIPGIGTPGIGTHGIGIPGIGTHGIGTPGSQLAASTVVFWFDPFEPNIKPNLNGLRLPFINYN